MSKLSYAFLIAIIASVSAQEPTGDSAGCDATEVCGGPLEVAASVVIEAKEINGDMVDFFACECLNGTRTAVSEDGTIIIPLNNAPAAAPVAAPADAPAASNSFDAAAYAAELKSTYPKLCARVNATRLSDPLTKPSGCRRPIKLGEVCWSSCRATLRGIGQTCYAAAVAKGAADPTLVGSNTTIAYLQCTRGVPYTTIEDYDPSARASPPPVSPPPASPPAISEASPAPAPTASSPAETNASPAPTPSPSAEGGDSPAPPPEDATPSTSAAWKPAVSAIVPLVFSLLPTMLI